jgi:hypothetical protein
LNTTAATPVMNVDVLAREYGGTLGSVEEPDNVVALPRGLYSPTWLS